MMSLTANSPANSSSSDDFAAFLDAELGTSSDQEEIEDGDGNEDDFEAKRYKRHKVDELDHSKEPQRSTSIVAMQQKFDASVNKACPHPAFFSEMCVKCGQHMNDGSAVAFGYIHKDLKVGTGEMARLRGSQLKNMLRNKKLYLILDLDHTLLNSTLLGNLSPADEYLKSQTDSFQNLQNRSLFKLDSIGMLTKLRPYVRTFLKEASSMYEMYIYTMAERNYAVEMARLLDPDDVYFHSKVISQADCTQKHQKGLDVVLGADSAVVILDDTEFVWNKHKENLILMERYHYFASSGRPFGIRGESLSELKRDESETDGVLASVLKVLKRVHGMFFDPGLDVDPMDRDVRQVLKTVRQEVLKDCYIVFSRVWERNARVENQKYWQMAKQLGASCSTNTDDSSVTHVVSTDTGTEKARWAVHHKKFLVNPSWIDAANYLWKRQPEEHFPVNDTRKQTNTIKLI